jgi:hypothetical protein
MEIPLQRSGASFPPRLRGGWPSESEVGWGTSGTIELRKKEPHRALPEGGEGFRTAARPANAPLERDLVAALEGEDFAGLVGGRDGEAEALDDLAGLPDLLGI